jgi:DNA repair exonuclease SbcCD ATPase subunit
VIKSVNTENFGVNKKLNIQLQPRLNVIIGPNRRGKTQILEAICFALFGKTQNSTLKKIINFDSDKAVVNLKLEELDFTRSRTETTSSLENVTKLELEQELNLNYQEFLSLYYISSNEQKSLFDATYLRKFLLSVFDLEKYSKIVQIMKAEYTGLKSASEQVQKTYDLDLLKKRFARVKKYTIARQERVSEYEQKRKELYTTKSSVSSKQGELNAKNQIVYKQYQLLKAGKCKECGRPYNAQAIQEGLKQCEVNFEKFKNAKTQITSKLDQCDKAIAKYDKAINRMSYKINQGVRIMSVLKERSKKTNTQTINLDRMRELEKLIPIFDPTGFPSYLLQIYVPIIIKTTNQLLGIIFPDTRVDIRMEKPESHNPDFKPFIHRKGEVLELQDLSGSERVLVNLCFRLGVMIIFRKLNKTCIDWMMIDEGFEKLDDTNALRILNLFENCFRMGILKQVLIVTHKGIFKTQENINYIDFGKITNKGETNVSN